MCLIREGRGVFRHLTVRENLQLQIPRGAKGADIERALVTFPKLRDRLGQRAGTLSGGEQQMLAVARCFSTKPSVILLDEVSMGLAPIIVGQIFDALTQLRELDLAILLVEQYVSRALALVDRVCLLDRGQIAFSGRPDDLTEAEIMRKYMNVDIEQMAPHGSAGRCEAQPRYTRPNSAPAFYLGRPASLWITAQHPRHGDGGRRSSGYPGLNRQAGHVAYLPGQTDAAVDLPHRYPAWPS
jgi:ABC-type multidrug transport system ATPase subunit